MERADTLASEMFQEEPSYQTVDENAKSNNNDKKSHDRKPSNGVQKQNKIINPVKHIERMATSGSFTIKETSQPREYFTVYALYFEFVCVKIFHFRN